jgi:hypothetical protein
MHGEARRHPVLWQMGGEVVDVCLGVLSAQPLLLAREPRGVDEGVRLLRLAAERVDLDEIDIAQ